MKQIEGYTIGLLNAYIANYCIVKLGDFQSSTVKSQLCAQLG
jgi:hypothetical protein